MSPDESSLLAPTPPPAAGDMARYQRIFEHAGIGVTRVGTDGVILECNDAFAHILGATPAEVVGLNVWDITHPDDRERDMAESMRVVHDHHRGSRSTRLGRCKLTDERLAFVMARDRMQ